MLDLGQLRDQLDAFREAQAGTADRRRRQMERALDALAEISGSWQALRREVEEARPSRLVADARQDPASTHAAPERPTPVTVVATDGSQIYPDRHVEPSYFLLNVGRVAFQYGTREAPLLDAVPDLRFAADLDDHFDAVLATMTTEVVSALRDEQELRELLSVAQSARVDDRPIVALADGTLIRWMLRGMQNRALEQDLIRRYTDMLQGFKTETIPIGSYISMPGNTELVNLIRFYLGELDEPGSYARGDGSGGGTPSSASPPAGPVEDDRPPEDASRDGAPAEPLDGLLDRHVVGRLLGSGERSALFSSTSHIQREYPEDNKICYFYVRIPSGADAGEVARVEIPEWVAQSPRLTDRVHAVVLRECKKGDGYPLILSEAHERAVIRAPEREAFQHLLERTLRRAGYPVTGSRKRRSKQRPKV
jgi:hypothetical protein